MNRHRDSQRSRVYAWERLIVEREMAGERVPGIREARALVDMVLAEHGLRWAPNVDAAPDCAVRAAAIGGKADFQAFREHLVIWRRGSRGGKYPAGGYCSYRDSSVDRSTGIPRLAQLRVDSSVEVILHEAAHLILQQTLGVFVGSWHDGAFVRALIDLLGRYSAAWRGWQAELIRSAREGGLDVAQESVLDARWRPREVAVAAASPPKRRRAASKRSKSTCESPVEVVREVAAANPKLPFGEIVKLAVARGVAPNTARGALVRIRRAVKQKEKS